MDTTDGNAEKLLQLQQQCTEYQNALLAPITRRNYAYAWGEFMRWSEEMGLVAMPAEPRTVKLYVAALLAEGRKVNTARHNVAAIRRQHLSCNETSPVTQAVKDLLRGARRDRGDQLRQALPLSVPELRAIADLQLADDSPMAARNLCIVLVGFLAALRNSSIAFLQLEDLEYTAQGALLKIRKSKTDQESKGRLVALLFGKHQQTCVIAALHRWIALRGDKPGYLFTRFDRRYTSERGLKPERIGEIVEELAGRIGVKTTGHGLRSGFATAAGTAGASDLNIGAHAGMTSMDTVRRYFRKRDAFVANPASILDL